MNLEDYDNKKRQLTEMQNYQLHLGNAMAGNLTYSPFCATIDNSAWDSQAFLMVKFKPFLRVNSFPNFKLKIKLGALLLCLSFLLNYHPAFTFPPVRRNVVYAQISQEQQVNSQPSPVTFQLPHPGYITTNFSSFHPGIDLCSGLGMPIKPIAKGTVVEAGFNFFGLGLMVEVEHEGGYRSLYGHMGKIYITKGQTVEPESFLGEIGMTGHTSGPHTHLEISRDGKKINPLLVLPEIRKYPKEEDFTVTHSATPSAIAIPTVTPQPASGSAKTIPSAVTTSAPPQFIEPPVNQNIRIEPAKTESTLKTDLNKKNLDNILDLASPKPSISPVPQGGPISFLNFGFFGFKKN
ncbi:MAG TPA: M23 family metallopeptidase [Patescibacteria group bacterium]|nr:M23 family metallopeptidase [Patescibacteria group bacterium]